MTRDGDEAEVDELFVERVRGRTMHHFSITDADDVPRLLRKMADRIEQLGHIDVFDITFRQEGDEPDSPYTMTAYVSFDDEGEADAANGA